LAEKKILRVLIVDDSPDDAELVVVALRKDGGFMLKSQRVQDLAGFQAALEKGDWDLVVSEFTLPHFSAQLAFDVLKSGGRDVPFVVLTHKIKDADLVKIMRAGVQDVILKDQRARFIPAVERELRAAGQRAEYHKAVSSLKEVETKHRAVIDGAREALCYSQDGMHVDANKAYLEMFGYENMTELEGVPVMNLIDKADQARFKEYMRKQPAGDTPQEFLAARKDGVRFHVEITLSAITLDGEQCIQLLCSDVSKRKAVETKLQYLNQHDALTGLYNRPYLMQELNKALERAKTGNGGGIVYVDFYELKQVTNQLGHVASDRFLIKAVKVLREALGDGAMLARFGDHEFVAYIQEANERRLATTAAAVQKILTDAAFTEGGQPIHCSFRVATGHIDAAAGSSQKILSEVCRSLAPTEPVKRAAATAPTPASPPAAAKAAPPPPPPAAAPVKPAPVAAAAPPPPAPPAPAVPPPAAPVAAPPAAAPAAANRAAASSAMSRASGDWHERLETALRKDGFQLTYQPIISLHGDGGEYFEVLVRMIGRDDELIAAGEFMPPAEASGQSVAIDRWVVRQAIRALADLLNERREVTFFVNLSATVLGDSEMAATVETALRECRVPPKFMVFELDEPAVVANAAAVATFMKTIKRLGCALCLDNFGKTLVTLNHLRDLPIEYLKIDGSLVRNLGGDAVGQAAFKAVTEVAKALNKKTIAKGVESADNLSVLWNLGVDYVMGNYFQQADAALNYEFSGETTISSDISVPQWANTGGKNR